MGDREILEKKIEDLILKSNLNYKDVRSILSKLAIVYRDKGENLLNATNIQKVIEAPRFISWNYDRTVRKHHSIQKWFHSIY